MTQPETELAPKTPTPLLVYNRIHANRRRTRLLLISFAVALLPAVVGIAVWIVPWIWWTYFSARPLSLTPTQGWWLYVGLNVVSVAIVTLVLMVATAFLIRYYGSRIVLGAADARPVYPGEEPDLVRVVENLCIGAGLPLPQIHVIESAAPNAFATGRNTDDASLVVTRGLLELLDRSELEGVIAHELSHIGNHDIAFNTTLAALVGTLSLPIRMLSAPFRFALRAAFRAKGPFGLVVMAFALVIVFRPEFFLLGMLGMLQMLVLVEKDGQPSWLLLWSMYVVIAPLYVVFVAPVVALLIRQAVSRQREFLADADAALLTRNPEGLALALVKIGAVGGERLHVSESTVHLYFVDPLSTGSRLLHFLFPSHPPLEKRVELLARMGNGIAPSAIQAARDAAVRVQHTKSAADEAGAPEPAPVLAPPPGDDHLLTPVYEQPDGWSRVLAQLPESAVVVPIAAEGAFIRVTMAEERTGYVSRSAPLSALKNFRP
jgi:heat shock protein HtpX